MCFLKEEIGGSETTCDFRLNGLEGESKGFSGYGVYGVAGIESFLCLFTGDCSTDTRLRFMALVQWLELNAVTCSRVVQCRE